MPPNASATPPTHTTHRVPNRSSKLTGLGDAGDAAGTGGTDAGLGCGEGGCGEGGCGGAGGGEGETEAGDSAGAVAGAAGGWGSGATTAVICAGAVTRCASSRSTFPNLASRRRTRSRSEIVITSATMAMTGKASAASNRMASKSKSNIEAVSLKIVAADSTARPCRTKASNLLARRHAGQVSSAKSFLMRSRYRACAVSAGQGLR